MENSQQIFGKRLTELMLKNNVSQQMLADALKCSRQSINFYTLGRRSPDISVAASIASYFKVSCDYLVGFSDYCETDVSHLGAEALGLCEESVKFIGGLKILAEGRAVGSEPAAAEATASLRLFNALISHDDFGKLLSNIRLLQATGESEKLFSALCGIPLAYAKAEGDELCDEFFTFMAERRFESILKDII